MKNVLAVKNLSQKSFVFLSMVLCVSMITSCGASKSDKSVKVSTPTNTNNPNPNGTATVNGTGSPAPKSGTELQAPTATNGEAGSLGAPVGVNQTTSASPTNSNVTQEVAAPVGRITSKTATTDRETSKDKSSVVAEKTIDFKQDATNKTGGQSGELSFTSASDDGIMALFKATSTSVSKEQQTSNFNLAQSIVGAKFIKQSAGGDLDLAMSEGGEVKFYKLSARPENNRLVLAAVSTTGQNQFQGGFVKCLTASCDESYAKVKFSGAYARIIFRTTYMNNKFGMDVKAQGSQYSLWKSYILNTVQGASTDARIESVRTGSYEVLNGKAAMGVQILTEDNEAVSFNMLLVAPDKGTDVNIQAKKVTDLSTNYDVISTRGKKLNLSNSVSDVKLVNNNGRGEVRLILTIDSADLYLTLQKKEKSVMSVNDIKEFESKLAPF